MNQYRINITFESEKYELFSNNEVKTIEIEAINEDKDKVLDDIYYLMEHIRMKKLGGE